MQAKRSIQESIFFEKSLAGVLILMTLTLELKASSASCMIPARISLIVFHDLARPSCRRTSYAMIRLSSGRGEWGSSALPQPLVRTVSVMISAPRCFGMVFHRGDVCDFLEPRAPPHPGKQRSALATWRRLTRALWAPGKIYSGTSLIQSSPVSEFWGPVSRVCRTASAPIVQ